MSELKTKRTDDDVNEFLAKVENDQRRQDSFELLEIYDRATGGMKPALWGSIVGYGSYHYKSERSSQEGDWPMVAFSPRKQSLTLYLMPGFDKYEAQLAKLGKHKTSVSCLYINKLRDVDTTVLERMIADSLKEMQRAYPNATS